METSAQFNIQPQDVPLNPSFQMSKFQLELKNAANKMKGRPRHCIRNAFRRIENAWRIRETDAELAAFSAITAQEEAATALIFALKIRGYKDANRLKPHSHPHKSGLMHMISAVGMIFHECNFPPISGRINPENTEARIDIILNLEQFGIMLPGTPDEPLNLHMSEISDGVRTEVDFSRKLHELASERNHESFVKFIETQANLRNELLYAGDDGIPHVTLGNPFFESHLNSICILTGITIAVLQAPKPQPLAEQVLGAYLEAMSHFSARIRTTPIE